MQLDLWYLASTFSWLTALCVCVPGSLWRFQRFARVIPFSGTVRMDCTACSSLEVESNVFVVSQDDIEACMPSSAHQYKVFCRSKHLTMTTLSVLHVKWDRLLWQAAHKVYIIHGRTNGNTYNIDLDFIFFFEHYRRYIQLYNFSLHIITRLRTSWLLYS